MLEFYVQAFHVMDKVLSREISFTRTSLVLKVCTSYATAATQGQGTARDIRVCVWCFYLSIVPSVLCIFGLLRLAVRITGTMIASLIVELSLWGVGFLTGIRSDIVPRVPGAYWAFAERNAKSLLVPSPEVVRVASYWCLTIAQMIMSEFEKIFPNFLQNGFEVQIFMEIWKENYIY